MKAKVICCNCDLKELGLYPEIKKGNIITVDFHTEKYYIVNQQKIPVQFVKICKS